MRSRIIPIAAALVLAVVALVVPLVLIWNLPGPAHHDFLRPGLSNLLVGKKTGGHVGSEIEHGIPIWVFFYLWYGNPEHDDGKYWHWTHPILQHWDPRVAEKFPKGIVEAPSEVASPGGVSPRRGLYSSRDPETLSAQMAELSRAGVTGTIVSWWGRSSHDDNGPPTEPVHMSLAFKAAEKHGVKISVHQEPYKGRTADSTCEDLSFLLDRYGQSPAWDSRIYVYDSYLTDNGHWKRVLSQCSARRRVKLVALILEPGDVQRAAAAGFDGVYTYFAAAGFTVASDPTLWHSIAESAGRAGLFFVPCVGPGYDDTAIRPWNAENKKEREDGKYFRTMWNSVPRKSSSIQSVAITSYNEWAEGTMIEPTEKDGGMYMDILRSFQWNVD
mmetsp:Transcript_61498/g.181740  ORF Transcript_61498/g.181740 Transcript_61498/m.181740 type:complete len:386 (-) Transcript_61498:114-1271(-)